MNVYGPGIAILFLVFVECVGVCWCYGTTRFSADIYTMLGFKPGIFWRVSWAFISPIFILVSLISSQDFIFTIIRNSLSISPPTPTR